MAEIKIVKIPISPEVIETLHVGDIVHLTGIVYTARDAAHQRMNEEIHKGQPLPIEKGSVIYYAGPCPPKPGEVIGSIGPTTASRMDRYSPLLIQHGLNMMIGKGGRNEEVKEAIQKYTGLYFAAIGGVAALMGKCVTSTEVIAYDDLGPEAIRRLTVVNLPVIVAIDSHGSDIYQ